MFFACLKRMCIVVFSFGCNVRNIPSLTVAWYHSGSLLLHCFSGGSVHWCQWSVKVYYHCVPLSCSFTSVQFSQSVMSDSATPWTAACQASLSITSSGSLLKLVSIESVILSNHPILPFAAPFSSCPQSFPALGSFPVSQLFASSAHSTGASASASVLPMNIQDCFPLGLTGLITLFAVQGTVKNVL